VPGDFGAPLEHAYVAVLIPAPLVASRVENVEDLTASRIARQNEALALLRAYLRTLERTPVLSPEVRAAAGEHVINLASLTLDRQRRRLEASQTTSVHEARFQVALAFIARHFREPDLSVLAVSAHQGISVRYLQKLLERKGLRFTEHVNALRLAEARRMLTSLDAGERSIIDIAHAAGFSDLSHFNRLFRRRYDATPGAVRSASARESPTTDHER
jgi:AraC-like DNA-binding protein